jgi:hypothetical protein
MNLRRDLTVMWQKEPGLLCPKLLPGHSFALLASITMRAIVMESFSFSGYDYRKPHSTSTCANSGCSFAMF